MLFTYCIYCLSVGHNHHDMREGKAFVESRLRSSLLISFHFCNPCSHHRTPLWGNFPSLE